MGGIRLPTAGEQRPTSPAAAAAAQHSSGPAQQQRQAAKRPQQAAALFISHLPFTLPAFQQLQVADDAACRRDVQTLSRITKNPEYLQVYDSLETGVQRSDMWRYTALYLHGGVYADVDVVAKPPMAELLNSLPADLNMSGVVFVESLPSPYCTQRLEPPALTAPCLPRIANPVCSSPLVWTGGSSALLRGSCT